MGKLTIGEVAQRAGVRTSALRYYESRGLLPAPPRESGHRRYEASILDQIAMIQLAQQAGFTIYEIQTLLNGFDTGTPPSERWHALAEQKMVEMDIVIARAQQMQQLLAYLMDCACPSLEECGKWSVSADANAPYSLKLDTPHSSR